MKQEFIITVDYFNGHVDSISISKLFDENDLALLEYRSKELNEHQSGIGRIRGVFTYPEFDSNGLNIFIKSNRLHQVGESISLGSNWAIQRDLNYGESLKEGQCVVVFHRYNEENKQWTFRGYLEVKTSSVNNSTASRIERYWRHDPNIFQNNLTHIGMLRAQNNEDVEGNYYDEVMTKEEIVAKYNQPENQLSSFQDLRELLPLL